MHLKKAAAGVGSLVTGVVRDVTTHWKRPAPGNFVSYREIVSLGLGGMGNQFTMVLVGYLALNAGNTLLGSTIGIRPVHLQIMLTIQTVLNVFFYFIRAKIVDNTRTKWGRFRPYIAFMGIPLAVLSIVFVFLPFQTMSYRDKLVWVFVFAIAVSMISPLFTDTYSELQTVISPNSEERAKVLSINSIIYSAAPTLTGLFVPILSNLTGGYTNINTYRYVLAPVTLIGLGLNFFTAIGCRERIVTSSTYVQKVGIFEGAWMILQNKHGFVADRLSGKRHRRAVRLDLYLQRAVHDDVRHFKYRYGYGQRHCHVHYAVFAEVDGQQKAADHAQCFKHCIPADFDFYIPCAGDHVFAAVFQQPGQRPLHRLQPGHAL